MTSDWKTTIVEIRDRGEWATFCVRESPVVPRKDRQGVDASAEWMCNSSFGCFAHYWSSMGCPFGEFIADIDDGYLLGKIGRRVTDSAKVVTELKRLVREARKNKDVDKDTAREAIEAIEELAQYDDGDVLCHKLYESPELNKVYIEWCDISSQTWDCQSKGFVKQIWPLFVKKFNEQTAERFDTASASG